MSNIVPHDPHRQRLVTATRVEDPTGTFRFPVSISETGLADTFILVHHDGNGASTLALLLEPFLKHPPLVIEVGTNLSRALQSIPQERYHHLPDVDRTSLHKALDWRAQRPGIPAIIECGRKLYREGIDAARLLANPPFNARAPLFVITNEHDRDLKLARLARQHAPGPVVVVGEAQGRWRDSDDGVIPIPQLTAAIASLIYADGLRMGDALRSCEEIFATQSFFDEYVRFGRRVAAELSK